MNEKGVVNMMAFHLFYRGQVDKVDEVKKGNHNIFRLSGDGVRIYLISSLNGSGECIQSYFIKAEL